MSKSLENDPSLWDRRRDSAGWHRRCSSATLPLKAANILGKCAFFTKKKVIFHHKIHNLEIFGKCIKMRFFSPENPWGFN